ncbi:hypothetical protein IJ00_05835 [Calothrix sp. 336/3]|nr:hypothetical protein IJ00_05835 [Calothrix sp. 336/3]
MQVTGKIVELTYLSYSTISRESEVIFATKQQILSFLYKTSGEIRVFCQPIFVKSQMLATTRYVFCFYAGWR